MTSILRPGYYLSVCLFGALAAGTTGCATNKALLTRQAVQIDSLQTEIDSLAGSLSVYRDSIAFYDFIDSGEFVQQMRFRDFEINRLQYTLAICRDGGTPLATELVDDLFEPASARLTNNGRDRLDLLADTVRFHAANSLVYIEGHSDATRPVGELAKRYPSNWELSAARAATIVRYFVEQHHIDESLFRVVSFGPANPVASNANPRGRRLNRRIRITTVPGPAN